MIQLAVVLTVAAIGGGFVFYLLTHAGRRHGPGGCAPSKADL